MNKLKKHHWYMIGALVLIGLFFLLRQCNCNKKNAGSVNAKTETFVNPNSANIDAELNRKQKENKNL